MFYEGFVLPRMPRQRRAEVARAGHHPIGNTEEHRCTEVARAGHPPWDTGEHWGTGKAKAKLRLS